MFGWLFGQWRFDASVAIGPILLFVGSVVMVIAIPSVEDAKERKKGNLFEDQLRRAQWGHLQSVVYVGALYMTEESERRPAGIKIDLAAAEDWFKRAAEKRYPPAHYWLSSLYLKQRRSEEAKLEINIAAAAGYAPAINLLGRHYLAGKLYEKDTLKGTQLLETAASRGNVMAQGALGRILLSSRKGSRTWFRGLRMFLGAYVALAVVLWKEGFTSDRLR